MAEMDFYINDNERKKMFEFLISENFKLVPDMRYYLDKYDFVESPEDFLRYIENVTVRFFILSHKYSIYPLYLTQNRYMSEAAFYVNQRWGGPYIDLALYRGFADDAAIKCKCTTLTYYSRYIKLQEEYQEFKATNDLITNFDRIVKYLKSKCKRIKVENRWYWVGNEVLGECSL